MLNLRNFILLLGLFLSQELWAPLRYNPATREMENVPSSGSGDEDGPSISPSGSILPSEALPAGVAARRAASAERTRVMALSASASSPGDQALSPAQQGRALLAAQTPRTRERVAAMTESTKGQLAEQSADLRAQQRAQDAAAAQDAADTAQARALNKAAFEAASTGRPAAEFLRLPGAVTPREPADSGTEAPSETISPTLPQVVSPAAGSGGRMARAAAQAKAAAVAKAQLRGAAGLEQMPPLQAARAAASSSGAGVVEAPTAQEPKAEELSLPQLSRSGADRDVSADPEEPSADPVAPVARRGIIPSGAAASTAGAPVTGLPAVGGATAPGVSRHSGPAFGPGAPRSARNALWAPQAEASLASPEEQSAPGSADALLAQRQQTRATLADVASAVQQRAWAGASSGAAPKAEEDHTADSVLQRAAASSAARTMVNPAVARRAARTEALGASGSGSGAPESSQALDSSASGPAPAFTKSSRATTVAFGATTPAPVGRSGVRLAPLRGAPNEAWPEEASPAPTPKPAKPVSAFDQGTRMAILSGGGRTEATTASSTSQPSAVSHWGTVRAAVPGHTTSGAGAQHASSPLSRSTGAAPRGGGSGHHGT